MISQGYGFHKDELEHVCSMFNDRGLDASIAEGSKYIFFNNETNEREERSCRSRKLDFEALFGQQTDEIVYTESFKDVVKMVIVDRLIKQNYKNIQIMSIAIELRIQSNEERVSPYNIDYRYTVVVRYGYGE